MITISNTWFCYLMFDIESATVSKMCIVCRRHGLGEQIIRTVTFPMPSTHSPSALVAPSNPRPKNKAFNFTNYTHVTRYRIYSCRFNAGKLIMYWTHSVHTSSQSLSKIITMHLKNRNNKNNTPLIPHPQSSSWHLKKNTHTLHIFALTFN
jgi:hypothetical protein